MFGVGIYIKGPFLGIAIIYYSARIMYESLLVNRNNC